MLDPGLPLPNPIQGVPRLGLQPDGSALSTGITAAHFLIEGQRVVVAGSQREAIGQVYIDARVVAGDIDASLGRPANLVLSPGRLRREWVGSNGACLETIVAASTLPLVAVQWATPSGSPETVSLTLLPGMQPVSYREGHGSVVASLTDAPDRFTAVAMAPQPQKVSAAPLSGGGLRVTAIPQVCDTHTLMITSGTWAEVSAALGVAPHMHAQERMACDLTQAGGLRLASGVPDLDGGVAWARARLAAGLAFSARCANSAKAQPDDLLWSGIGALAVGDDRSACHALAVLDRTEWMYAALLAGRITHVTGDAEPSLRFAERFAEGKVPAVGEQPKDPALVRLALQTLADGLRHAAPERVIAGLRHRAAAAIGSRSARRLPTVGAASEASTLGDWLTRSLGRTALPPAPPPPGAPPSVSAWSRIGPDPDAAWVAWRNELTTGMHRGISGPGSWDSRERSAGGAPNTGGLLAAFVHGFLGVAPDAPVGRIRIGPRLPSHLTELHVSGLVVADAEVGLSYERDGSRHRFTLEPELGRVPPVVVFEPSLPGRVARVWVDGAPATLTASASGARTTVSAQVPVDTIRTVEVDGE